MKAIRNYVDKIKPNFEKGGKLESFNSFFDAIETFLFVPNKVSKNGVHVHDPIDLKRTMIIVIVALIPSILFGAWNVGYQNALAYGLDRTLLENFWVGMIKLLPIIIVSYGVGLGIEIIMAQKRGHEVNEGFFVSGMLIPLIVPINIPLWMLALAVAFAVVFGKEVFGGTGYNIMNVALVARAFLFFAYPGQMSGDSVWVLNLKDQPMVDGFSGATPLALLNQTGTMPSASLADMFFGFIPGSVGETSVLAILIGAAILIFTGVGSWKIMLSTVLGALGMGYIFNLFGINAYMGINPVYHLVMGGLMFGAVFMATDPVTATSTEKGKWIYGAMIGILVVLIRVVNPAYPEGTMLAILLMNVWAPLIDYYVVESNVKKRLKRIAVK